MRIRAKNTALLLMLHLCVLAFPALADTFTVNSNDDATDGACDAHHCSLREAINAANALPGKDEIAFAIDGTGPQTIQPQSELPKLTDSVIIDGYTQPGASPNTNPIEDGSNATLMIEIDGSNTGSNASGLRLGAGDSEVRGLAINRFNWMGIQITSGEGTIVAGNFIGTDTSGTQDPGNGFAGVLISGSDNNRVGGTSPEDRNVISGNADSGVWIVDADGNQVQGNYIGTDLAGTSDLGNSDDGVTLQNASNSLIGGTSVAARNVIAENNRNGVYVCCSNGLYSGNQVQGNFIGTDVTGMNPLANGSRGLLILGGEGHLVGGSVSGAGNVISANEGAGITLGLEARQVTVQGNLIGTDVAGTGALGNEGEGIRISPSSRDSLAHQIGGSSSPEGNVISANLQNGILLSDAETTIIEGNHIGTSADGSADLGNGGNGVYLHDALSNRIGGQSSSAGNVIAFNRGHGIQIVGIDTAPVNNAILSNSIFANSDLGIELGNDGVTENDDRDSDDGPNALQNYPALLSVRSGASNETIISGHLRSVPDTEFILEFFVVEACDGSGHGEGEKFLGSATGSTNNEGDLTFSFMMSANLDTDEFLVATATDDAGNTSEFSQCEQVMEMNTPASFRVERETGNVFTDGSLNPDGADLAERIHVSEPVEPGDVVAIDPDRPEHYRKTRQAHSSLAAGVIASDPGVVLGAEATTSPSPFLDLSLPAWISPTVTINSGVNFSLASLVPRLNVMVSSRPVLALMGQVPVKATTENGSIQPGDLLVSSSTPGRVMRCAKAESCEGVIIGKALESLRQGRGTIRMLVIR